MFKVPKMETAGFTAPKLVGVKPLTKEQKEAMVNAAKNVRAELNAASQGLSTTHDNINVVKGDLADVNGTLHTVAEHSNINADHINDLFEHLNVTIAGLNSTEGQ